MYAFGFGIPGRARPGGGGSGPPVPADAITDPRDGYAGIPITDPRPGYENTIITYPEGYEL